MSIPNLISVVESVRDRYPAQWRAAHRGGPDTDDFIKILAWELHQRDSRCGLNGKRGNAEDISDDAICYDGVSLLGDVDPTRGNVPVTVLDVIGGAGGPNPVPTWNAVGPATPRPHAAWVQPQPPVGVQPKPGVEPKPEPQPQPQACAFDRAAMDRVTSALVALTNEVAALKTKVEGVGVEAASANHEAKQAAARAADLKDTLAKGAAIEGGIALSLRGGGLRDVRATFDVTNRG